MTRSTALVFTCLAGLASLTSLSACAPPPHDYALYRSHMPRSILVLPPVNETTDVDASYAYLSTISRPLAECGYYVFPVAVIDAYMKENGLPSADEMHAVSLQKLREIIGADAVLYVIIEEWGQKYRVITSTTVVKARARLVDAATGETLWNGTAHAAQSSGGGDPIGMLVAAVVAQILDSITDQAHALAGPANAMMIHNENQGLLYGHRHPRYDADSRGR